MRYDKGHKGASRRQILDAASQRFRKDGLDAVGIASLMADAGLTHGAFYGHFDSKEELAREALGCALKETRELLAGAAEKGGVSAMIHTYLQPRHRDNPDRGCAIAALAAEIGRHPLATRAALTGELVELLDVIAGHLAGPDRRSRQDRAVAVFGAMVGTLQLARMVSDPVLSARILRNGEAAALALAKGE